MFSYAEFEAFLKAHPGRQFDMNSPTDCAGAVCSGRNFDDQCVGTPWFDELQRRTKGGVWLGSDLLRVLREIGDAPFPAARKRK
jgi:hypothetical protein